MPTYSGKYFHYIEGFIGCIYSLFPQLWSTFFRPELVEECCKQTLENLKLSYIDLYLLHSPMALQPGHGLFPSLGENGSLAFDSVPLISTWKAMEMLVDKGLVMSVGLSNFNRRQIEEIWHHSRIRPTNLQIEAHANFPNAELVAFAQSLGMSVTAYAPLGSPGGFRGKTCLLDQHWVCEIADAHGKTAAQVLLRYLLQRNMIVIPKSSRPEKIVENSKIFDFELTREEMRRMDNFGLNERQFKFKKFKDHPEYPFNDPF